MSSSTTHTQYRERILRVLVHIQQRLQDPPSLDELAEIAGFSTFHFHRIFRGLVGEPVQQHLRRLRLERAAQRLKFGSKSILQVALEAGFESHEAFTRAFRSHFDCTPSEFRKQQQERWQIAAPTRLHYSEDPPESFEPAEAVFPEIEVEIVDVEPKRVAFLRHTGPYNEVGQTWQKMMAWAWPRGYANTPPIGLCYDDPDITDGCRIRYDACVRVKADVKAEGGIGVQEIPGGLHGRTVHIGPYEKLGEAWLSLCGSWLVKQGHVPAPRPGFEIYLNSPLNTPPEELRTELYIPLQ